MWREKIPWEIVRSNAKDYLIDPDLVAAIIWQESKANPLAIRYEPNFRFRKEPYKYARFNGITEATENLLQSCSFGMMQVMGCVVRELGHQHSLLELTEAEVGIKYGCKVLSNLLEKYKTFEEVISSYNQGSPLRDKRGVLINIKYVTEVIAHLKYLKGA